MVSSFIFVIYNLLIRRTYVRSAFDGALGGRPFGSAELRCLRNLRRTNWTEGRRNLLPRASVLGGRIRGREVARKKTVDQIERSHAHDQEYGILDVGIS